MGGCNTNQVGVAVKLPAKVITTAIAAASAVAIPFIAGWEGKRNDPYTDLAKIQTVCYGETRVPMRRYTDAECLEMLKEAVTEDFMRPVLECTPTLAFYPYALASTSSSAYNIGVARYCNSSAAKKFKAGDISGGCHALTAYNGITYLKPQKGLKCRALTNGKWFCEIPGLVNRRKAELELCLMGERK